jgi:hypothetical protein
MNNYDSFFTIALDKYRCLSSLAAALAPALLLAGGAWAQPATEGPVKVLFTVPVPIASTNKTDGLYAFDVSSVDPATQTYYLSDRSNSAIDAVDANTGKFLKQIRATPGFAGLATSCPDGDTHDCSGPNGNVASYPWLFAGDASSRVVSTVSNANTGGTGRFRADEMAYDPTDGMLLVNNDANAPVFGTFISVDKSTGKLTVGKHIDYPFATNGLEAPVWDSATGLFYQSIPQTGDASNSGGGPTGLILALNPKTAKIVSEFPVYLCQPMGLALNPGTQNLLAGCGVIFNTAGKVWDPTKSVTATQYQVVVNAKTGVIEAYVPGVGGSDQVWYNPGDNDWYTASDVSPLAPNVVVTTPPTLTAQGAAVLGVIDGTTLTLSQLVPTFNVPATATHSSAPAHSVAANPVNNWVFVPLGANNVFQDCLTGCIAVYGRSDSDPD